MCTGAIYLAEHLISNGTGVILMNRMIFGQHRVSPREVFSQ